MSRIRGRAARQGRLGPLCSSRRNVAHSRGPPSSARRSAPHVARQDASDPPARAGRAASETAGTAPSSTERPVRGRGGIGRGQRELDSLGVVAVCVSEVHSRCLRSSPPGSYRHGARLGVIDRAPIPVSAGTPGWTRSPMCTPDHPLLRVGGRGGHRGGFSIVSTTQQQVSAGARSEPAPLLLPWARQQRRVDCSLP